jgi:hypothetical protein
MVLRCFEIEERIAVGAGYPIRLNVTDEAVQPAFNMRARLLANR